MELIRILADLGSAAFLQIPPSTFNRRALTSSQSSPTKAFLHDQAAIQQVSEILSENVNELVSQSAFSVYAWIVFAQQWPHTQPSGNMEDIGFLDPQALEKMAGLIFDSFGVLEWICVLSSSLRTQYKGTANIEFENHLRELILGILSLTVDLGFVPYEEPRLLGALLAVLDSERSYVESPETRIFAGTSSKEIIDKYLQPFLTSARSRFPIETSAYVHLIRPLFMLGEPDSFPTLQLLEHISSMEEFTEVLSINWQQYEQVDEDYPDADRFVVELKEDLPIFVLRTSGRRLSSSTSNRQSGSEIVPFFEPDWQIVSGVPRQTRGEVRNTEKPLVISWQMGSRPLSYLVDCLATAVPGSDKVLYAGMSSIPQDEVVEIIRLLAAILRAAYQSSHLEKSTLMEMGREILQLRFNDRDQEQDVITMVYEIFEYNLQKQKTDRNAGNSTTVLTACIEFFHATTYFSPNRVWPILVRSRLLDLNGSEPAFESVVANSEVLTGDFSFFLGCVHLFDRLVDLAYTQPLSKGTSMKKSLSRLAATTSSSINFLVPPKTVRSIVRTFFMIVASAFESSQSWRFADSGQRNALNASVLSICNKLLTVTYGYDEEPDMEKKFSSTLAESAELLVSDLLTPQQCQPICNAVLRIISQPLPTVEDSGRSYQEELSSKLEALNLCETALRIASRRSDQACALENQLFKDSPILARLYATSDKLKICVSRLMEVLLSMSSRGNSQPSLLGHMGPKVAKNFLSLISQLHQPLSSDERDVATWNLLQQVMKSQQQWFALYLLTGKTPRESGDGKSTPSQSILKYALDALSKLNDTPWQRLRVPNKMLGFVALSYDKWPATAKAIREHNTFLPSIIDYFAKLRRDTIPSLGITMQAQIASSIAQILTMHLLNCRELGDFRFASSLVNKLGYLKNYGFSLPSMNRNQQQFLAKNLSDIYPGFSLARVCHTDILRNDHVESYAYDYQIALKLIESVKGRGDHKGFVKEIQWTNINLAEVAAQFKLQKQCKLLAVELAEVASRDPQFVLVDPLLDVVRACCVDMRNMTISIPRSSQYQRSQIELVEIIFQKLTSIDDPKVTQELVSLFPTIWQSFCDTVDNFGSMYTGPQADLNRRFLKILFLSLRPMVKAGNVGFMNSRGTTRFRLLPAKHFSELTTIATDIVPRAFKSLSELAHDEDVAKTIEAGDFVLITALFQTVIQIPGMESQTQQIALNLANSNVARYALNLFSWSDQLLIDGDPVFGELSMLFLLELSSVSAMADTLAAQGILVQLSSANLMGLFSRKMGVGPFDKPVRLHSIWVRGVLRLCLNLLDAVGPPVVVEIVSFLAQYANQADRLIRQLQNRRGNIGTRPGQSHITFNMAAEAHSMAVLSAIIDGLRSSGSMAGNIPASDIPSLPWDRASLKEEIDDWVSEKDAMRRHVIPANDREAALFSQKPSNTATGCANRLEEVVFLELTSAAQILSGNGA